MELIILTLVVIVGLYLFWDFAAFARLDGEKRRPAHDGPLRFGSTETDAARGIVGPHRLVSHEGRGLLAYAREISFAHDDLTPDERLLSVPLTEFLPDFGEAWHKLTEDERKLLMTDPRGLGGFHIGCGLLLMANGKDQSDKDDGVEMLRSVRPGSSYLPPASRGLPTAAPEEFASLKDYSTKKPATEEIKDEPTPESIRQWSVGIRTPSRRLREREATDAD